MFTIYHQPTACKHVGLGFLLILLLNDFFHILHQSSVNLRSLKDTCGAVVADLFSSSFLLQTCHVYFKRVFIIKRISIFYYLGEPAGSIC